MNSSASLSPTDSPNARADGDVDAAEAARQARSRLEATRAALLARIDGDRKPSRAAPGSRPTVRSLLGEARQSAEAAMASLSSSRATRADDVAGRMAAASDRVAERAASIERAAEHHPISKHGLAHAARQLVSIVPVPPLVPVLDSAIDTAEGWWRRQPWYDASDLLIREAESTLGPTIRRNPLLSVSAAAAFGAAVVMARPWRWKTFETSLKPVPELAKGWFKDQFQRSTVQSMTVAWVLGLAAKAGRSASDAEGDAMTRRMAESSRRSDTGADSPRRDGQSDDARSARDAADVTESMSTAASR